MILGFSFIGGFDWRVLTVIPAGILFGLFFGAWSEKKINGVTGDILGAGSEITEVIVLAIGSALC
jgi:cobalamin synthase